jgi:hypothetical protein
MQHRIRPHVIIWIGNVLILVALLVLIVLSTKGDQGMSNYEARLPCHISLFEHSAFLWCF